MLGNFFYFGHTGVKLFSYFSRHHTIRSPIFILSVCLQQLCSAMAVIQHVTHIAIFSWMLVEGIHLYIKVVKVFSVRKLYITYVCIGWGKIQDFLN